MCKCEISKFFVQYLEMGRMGRKINVPIWKIVKAILFKIKTGVQWEHLSMRQFFGFTKYCWQSVYNHFNKWSLTGVWEECYRKLLADNNSKLDHAIKYMND